MSRRYLTMRLVALPPDPPSGPERAPERDDDDPVARWVTAARGATDPCIVIDALGRVAALSPPAATMFGHPPETCGPRLDEILVALDFSDAGRLAVSPAGRRMPPLVAVQENQLSRGVLRVRGPDGRPLMLDAVATPIHDESMRVVGSLSFFAAV